MGDTITIAGLRRKRAEIAGVIADHEKKARHWKEALAHVDATLRLFSGEIDPDAIPGKRIYRSSRFFSGSELSRFVMDQLRQAGEPISAGAIFKAAVETHGIPDDARTRVTLTERILRYLREKHESGMIEKLGVTHDARWRVPDTKKGPEWGSGP